MYRFCYLSLFLLFTVSTIFADANKSVGSGGDYEDLTAAFTAINSGQITGVIVLRLTTSTALSATAQLNASGTGSASYLLVLIYPDVAGITISSSQPVTIQLNGADNITIDGRVDQAGNSDLIISNSSLSANSAAISLYQGASNNSIRYCTIKGSCQDPSGGVVVIAGVSALGGCSTNLIEQNNITNEGGNRPMFAINCKISTGAINSGNIIRNNNIYNTINLNNSGETAAINASGANPSLNVEGNSIYEETTVVPTNTAAYYFIKISSTDNTDITISGNYIGGTEPLCGGTKLTKSSANSNQFAGIYLKVGTSIKSEIQGNIISNISWSNSANNNFMGIYAEGMVDVGTTAGNVVGNTSGTGSIFFENATNAGNFYGIYAKGTYPITIENNCIGSLIVGNSDATAGVAFRGIYVLDLKATSVTDNIIGNATEPNSINLTSTATSSSQYTRGIECRGISGSDEATISNNLVANINNASLGTLSNNLIGISVEEASYIISGNTIHDLTISNLSTSISNSASLTGIVMICNYQVSNSVTNNTIYNLSNTNPSFTGAVTGIYLFCVATKAHITTNRIYNLSVDPASTSATLRGIIISGGSVASNNNMISLVSSASCNMYGIYDGANPSECYYNTIVVSGTQPVESNNSFSILSPFTSTLKYKNNILVNSRTRLGGSSVHSAVYIDDASVVDIDYNNYYSTGEGGRIGSFGSYATTLAQWQGLTGQDVHSKSKQVFFVDSTSNLHLTGSSVGDYDLTGLPIIDLTTDFDGDTRSLVFPYMGADEINDSPLPVELVSFTAKSTGTTITLNWETKTEIDNYGFEIERKSSVGEWIKIGFIEGHGTSNSPKYYTFKDKTPDSDKYLYRLKQLDNSGTFEYSPTLEVNSGEPAGFSLSQNYPNPFNPETVINYTISIPSFVTIEIFDLRGSRISVPVSENMDAGYHSIKIDANKLQLSSGVYIYKLSVIGVDGEQFSNTKKFVLMK
jgi:hypothetical protein